MHVIAPQEPKYLSNIGPNGEQNLYKSIHLNDKTRELFDEANKNYNPDERYTIPPLPKRHFWTGKKVTMERADTLLAGVQSALLSTHQKASHFHVQYASHAEGLSTALDFNSRGLHAEIGQFRSYLKSEGRKGTYHHHGSALADRINQFYREELPPAERREMLPLIKKTEKELRRLDKALD